jgi:hypothetical protein
MGFSVVSTLNPCDGGGFKVLIDGCINVSKYCPMIPVPNSRLEINFHQGVLMQLCMAFSSLEMLFCETWGRDKKVSLDSLAFYHLECGRKPHL